jgi:hypothetical protein
MRRLGLIVCLTVAALAATSALAGAASAAPSASTGGANNLSPQGATINGTVNPRGAPTSYYFQFGTTRSYGNRTPTGDAGAGRSGVKVVGTLIGLTPNTTYHYRLVAFSPAGTTNGSDRSFKTPQVPTTASIAFSPNPAVFGKTIAVSGTLSGPDVGGKQVVLQTKIFPFTGAFKQFGNTVVTTPTGGYSFFVPALINVQLRVAEKSAPKAMSQVVTAGVALKVSLKALRSKKVHNRIRFSGRVAPLRTGNAVLIQRHTKRGWTRVGLTLTRTGTGGFAKFAKKVRLSKGGRFRALVKTTGGDLVDGHSRSVRVSTR